MDPEEEATGKRLYGAMFIVNATKAKEDYEPAEQACLDCITRHGGEIVKSIKWDTRRLAYPIQGVKRGTYILAHFHSEGDAIRRMERQARLSETVLRVLITRDEDGVETDTGNARARAEDATSDKPGADGEGAAAPSAERKSEES